MISNEYLVSDRNSNLIKLRKRAEESNLTPKEEALFITMYARTKTGRKNQTYQVNCFVASLRCFIGSLCCSTPFHFVLHFVSLVFTSCSTSFFLSFTSCSTSFLLFFIWASEKKVKNSSRNKHSYI